ncbi:MAG: ATP-binding protein [Gammaproteobacteria bacterium]
MAFSIFLLAFAWQNALETARRQFAFESVSIGNTLGQNVTSADEVSEYLASLLADPRGEARAAFPALAKSALSQHLFLNAVGYESIAELSSIKDPGADKAATKQRTQTSVSSTPTNEGTDSHAFLMQLPREPQLTTADLLAVINHPEILSTVFSAAGAIPTGVATSGPLAGKYLLVRAVREAGTHSSVVPRSDPLGVLLMVIDPSMLLGPTARQENLSISLISESEGVVGRQFLFNEANRSADSEDGWVITRLTESTSVQLPASSFRLLIGKPVHWRSIEHGLIYTALFLGGGITLLLVALARARELQARELRERNFEIERQVLRQTRELAVARDEALSASRVKSDFLASMSHEIRTPLNAIIGMSELLGETSLNDEQSRYVGVFRKAGEALLSLVNDILDLSKIEAKQLTLESIELNLRELVENAVDLYVLKAGEKGLSLSSRVAVALPNRLLGDPTRLRQVLLNLIGNAIKFTERGGIAVRVTAGAAHSSRRRLHFSVEDTGLGIPENKLESIFSSFTQVDSSTTRKYGGTGLGLAISKHLVQMMGGNLSVNSQLWRG